MNLAWPRVAVRSLFVAACALGAFAGACDDDGGGPSDASVDAPVGPGPSNDAGGGSTLAVDFTITGCERLERDPLRCIGSAPLRLTFVPVTTASVGQLLWDFGDQTPRSSETTPAHQYVLPGRYDVTLVGGGPGGSIVRAHPGAIEVLANPVGASCDVASQCAEGLTCLCGSAASCSAAFARGICTASCRAEPCAGTSVCSDLALGGSGQGQAEEWRGLFCLAPCTKDAECGRGLRCRQLPARYPAGRWTGVCFVAEPASLGAACRSPAGELRNEVCASGLCADLGANGLCALDCERAACPDGTACGKLTSGEALCLPVCATATACTQDPLLSCEAPGAPGPRGFVADGLAPGTKLCAPKRCANDADCGPAGTCAQSGGGGHCRRRP